MYGWEKGEGITEQIIGTWFAQGGGRRERTVLATKLYGAWASGRTTRKLSALNIRRACDASLRRLQTDHIDLYQMHHVDRATPWEEIWEAFDVLRQQGKVIYFGSSNFAGWHIAQAQEAAARVGTGSAWSPSSPSTTCWRARSSSRCCPAAQRYGLGVIPWSPLHGGLLGGVAAQGARGRRRRPRPRRRRRWSSTARARSGTRSSAPSWARSPADVALAWLLAQPGVTAPIIGPRTVEQLDGALHALEVTLDAATLARLDEIFPGPGGRAPEAYAW